MSKPYLPLLVAAILLGWSPVVSLWFNPPPLMGDEAYYARVPVEMRERGDWVVPYFNGEPRYKKPPLMYWLVALSQSVFGETEFASRLPSTLAVILIGVLLFWFGAKVGDAETGAWAAASFLLNPMTVILGNWGAPEAMLCLFVTASVLFGLLGLFVNSLLWLALSGAAAGLGILTKGAPGLILPAIALFPVAVWESSKHRTGRDARSELKKLSGRFALWLLICLAVAAPWFVAVWLREGEKFWQVFLLREHIQRVAEPMEGHKGPAWFYLPVLWLLFLPWSICLPHALANALRKFRRPMTADVDFPMAWWALSVVALFSLAATKLPHYIFPAFPALSWLVASQIQRDWGKGEFLSGLALAFLPVPLLLYGALAGTETYAKFIGEMGFKTVAELDGIRLAAYILLSGFSSLPLIWGSAKVVGNLAKASGFAEKKTLLLGGTVLTMAVLVAVSILANSLGGRKAIGEWLKAQHLATFGSDTEWAVFYAKQPVPMLGRNRERLLEFLTQHQNAAILARVDFAPALRREGLTLKRFGIWCVAFSQRRR